MIAPTPFFADRGCHVRIYEEIQSLQRLGHKIKLVTYHLGGTPKGINVIRIPKIFFWYKKLEAGPSWWKPFLDLILLIQTAIVYKREKFDLIHAHLHEGVLIGYLIRFLKFRKIPLVFDFQGSLTGELLAHHFIREHKNLHGFFKFAENIINNMPDFIITSSMGSYNLLINEYDINPKEIKYVRDGVGSGFYKIPSKKELVSLKNKLGVDLNKKVIFFMGVLSEYQGLDILLNSASEIIKKNKNIHFLIVGYPNVDIYKLKAKKLGLDDFVTFTGRIPYLETHQYIGLADIAVSPKISKTEANGKLYYYAAAGIASIVFDSPVNKEILGDLGIYAKFNNNNDYTKKLLFAISNDKKVKEISSKLKLKAKKDFSWDKSIGDVVDVYKKLKIYEN